MAARATMANLILFVRRKIGDPAGGSQTFSDDDIQAELDAVRLDVAPFETLIPVYTYSGNSIVWLDHYSRFPFWEDSPLLLDMGLNVLTASATEPLREPDSEGKAAHFQFATTQLNVRARGHSYDVWNAAANLLEDWITNQARNMVNINVQGSNLALNQTIQTWEKRVMEFRSKQRIGSVTTYRDDVLSHRQWQKQQDVGIVAQGIPFLTGQ